jgi:hypothetical protein
MPTRCYLVHMPVSVTRMVVSSGPCASDHVSHRDDAGALFEGLNVPHPGFLGRAQILCHNVVEAAHFACSAQ